MMQKPVHFSFIKFCLNKSLKRLLFCFLPFLLILTPLISFSQITSTAGGGSWSVPATWVGGLVPTAGQSVTIAGNVSLDYGTPVYNNITVNAGVTLNITNTATCNLNYSGNMVVSGSVLNNGGILQTTASGRTFQLAGIGSYTHNPRNNTALDESIFSRSNENFSTTSTLTINKWFDLSIPLGDPTRVGTSLSSVFGNVIMNVADTISWEQDGLFMNAGSQRVFGTLTVSAGSVTMDNGTGLTSLLILNSVVVSGTGNIIFSSIMA